MSCRPFLPCAAIGLLLLPGHAVAAAIPSPAPAQEAAPRPAAAPSPPADETGSSAAAAGAAADSGAAAGPVFFETATVQARPLSSATASVTVLDRRDVESSGARTIGELMRFIPGVDLLSNGARGGLSLAAIPTFAPRSALAATPASSTASPPPAWISTSRSSTTISTT